MKVYKINAQGAAKMVAEVLGLQYDSQQESQKHQKPKQTVNIADKVRGLLKSAKKQKQHT